jgi:hypothetical protein
MRKYALSLIALLLISGCRFSRSPEASVPVQPATTPPPVISPEPAPSPEPAAVPVEAASPAAEIAPLPGSSVPGVRDYYDALAAFLAQAQADADKGKIAELQSLQGALAGANRSLSLLEAALPRVWILQGVQRAQQLLAAKKTGEAAAMLAQLARRLQDVQAALPSDLKDCAAVILKSRDNITAGKTAVAAGQLAGMAQQVSLAIALGHIQEIRANLQDASLAAKRGRPAVVKAVLEDTGQDIAKLGELLPAPGTREGNPQ